MSYMHCTTFILGMKVGFSVRPYEKYRLIEEFSSLARVDIFYGLLQPILMIWHNVS